MYSWLLWPIWKTSCLKGEFPYYLSKVTNRRPMVNHQNSFLTCWTWPYLGCYQTSVMNFFVNMYWASARSEKSSSSARSQQLTSWSSSSLIFPWKLYVLAGNLILLFCFSIPRSSPQYGQIPRKSNQQWSPRQRASSKRRS